MNQYKLDAPIYQERPITTLPTRQPSLWLDLWPTLDIALRFVLCLASIALGIHIAVRGNDATAVLAAFGCAAVIYGLLSPKKES